MSKPRKPLDPELIAAVQRGALTLRAAAAKAGVSHTTIARAVKAAPPLDAPPPPPAPPTAAKPGATLDPAIEIIRAEVESNRAQAAAARESGDWINAQRFSRTIATQLPALLRAEQAASEDADVLQLSRSDIEAAMAGVRARVAALAERPLLCAHCSRELSVAWGVGDPPTEKE